MMTLLKQVLVLLLFALPILESASRFNGPVKTRSTSKSKCRDLKPKWCNKLKLMFSETFEEECRKIGSNNILQIIFCCKTCKDLVEKQVTTVETTTRAMTTQHLMYTRFNSQTIYSYTLDGDRDPLKIGQFKIPYSTKQPLLVFNSQLNCLEVIGDWQSGYNKNHKLMTIAGLFKDATDSLFNGDAAFEVAHSANVGTLVFSAYGHSDGSTQVYIITPNSNWYKIKSSDKYLSPFQNPGTGSWYKKYGVVEHKDKVYLVGGLSGSDRFGEPQNTIQVINFQNVDKLQTAKTRQWIFLENLKNTVYGPAMIVREEKLLIVGSTDSTACLTIQYNSIQFKMSLPRKSCQDVQFLNLASNRTGVDAGTVVSGRYETRNDNPGIYDIVGGDISIFGGSVAGADCIQQTASGDNFGMQWKCVPSSKSAFEGLMRSPLRGSNYIRYSNFIV